MKNSYEVKKFNRLFFWVAAVMLFVCAVFCYLIFEKVNWKLYALISLFFVFEVVVYFIAYKQISDMTEEITNIAQIMTDILYDADKIPQEKYMPGEIGNLYTNLYKLVMALKQSNLKEQEEKIFLRDVISDISHQLKTPLASLSVFTQLLREDRISEPEKQKQILEESQNQIQRMEWMVLSMLKLARIEAGAIEFDIKGNKLSDIIAQAVEAVNYMTEEKNQKIEVNMPENLMLSCDRDWLTEAIINLLKNASDYSENDTCISIEIEDTPMFTRINIRDQGVGIAEENLQNIFKRFYRVNNEVNPNSVGIGLSLTKSIIEGMGGRISVDSKLGEYTVFKITFVHT